MSEYRVEMDQISKSFGGVHALNDVSLSVRPGEIHALVGENGAGKSTLMKILSGAYQKDSGIIRIDSKVLNIPSPHAGRKLGIGIIYQELALANDLSVAENIFLDRLSSSCGLINWRKLYREADELINSIGFNINPRSLVGNLSVAYQQVVEITKALSEKTRILILDEPTSVLAPSETDQLFDVLRKLKEQDVSIIYISHRLEEIFRIADTITVIKDGEVTGTVNPEDVTTDDIISMMIGRTLSTLFPERNSNIGYEILRVENLCSGRKVKDVSFSLHAGEVLGIAGLVGSGRTETVRAIFGADKKNSGNVLLDGIRKRLKSPTASVKAGIGFVPEDRKSHGTILSMSIRKNVSMPSLWKKFSTLGLIKHNEERKATWDLIERLKIKTRSTETAVTDLSGGNQQKVVLAKWLGRDCRVLILDEPTRGVDVGAKVEIYNIINELAESGLGIIAISSEMMEIIGICDRVLVMREGCVQGTLEKHELTEENIMNLAIMRQTA